MTVPIVPEQQPTPGQMALRNSWTEMTAPLQQQEQEQPGFIERWLKRGVDIALGLPRSAINAFNENAQAANDLVTLAAQTPGVFPGGPSVAAAFAQETDPLEIPQMFGEPETFLGGMSEGISRFTLNMIGLGKVLGTAKAIGGVVRYGSFVGRAALTDATAFDPFEERLANLVEAYGPDFAQPVAAFMASDPAEDTVAEARLKAALEGFVLGSTIDAFVVGLRALRAARGMRAGTQGAEERLAQEVAALDRIGARGRGRREALGEGTVEMVKADRAKPSGELSREALQRVREAIRVGRAADPRDVELAFQTRGQQTSAHDLLNAAVDENASRFNLKYVDVPEGQKGLMSAISEQLPAKTVQGHAATRRLAGTILSNDAPDGVIRRVGEVFGQEATPQLLTAARTVLWSMGDYVHRMARIVDRNPQNAVAAEEFARAVDALHGTAQIVADAGSQAGRNLEAMKIVVGAKRGLLPQIRGSIEGMSRADVLAQARRVVLTEGDPAKIIGEVRAGRELQMGKGERFLRRVVSYRIQNLLSGPHTHVVNSVSNAITSALRPAEMIYAGTISRNPALRQQGWDILAGNFMYLKDAWTSMRKAFRAGDSLLDPHHTTDDRTIRMGITGSKRVDPLLEIPSRFLISEDEFFKNYQYRSFIRSRSLRHSRELGLVDPREMAKRVDDDIRNTFDLDTGRGLDEEGIQWARVSTFTNDLGVGTFAQGIQSFVNKHPMAKILIPFFRTPANLARFVGQRTPLLARWGRQWKMDVAAGGERAAMARAREQVGLMFWSTAAFLAASGRMTGRGPRNKNLRETWLQTHRPYSVRIGDQWVSLRRGDPVLTPFTLVADAFEIWPELGGQDQLRMVATVSAAVAANITDKTYLSSLTQAVEGFTSDEPARMSRVMKELVFSSAIPFSAGLRQFANTDQYYRETANLIDELARRVPGWSETLEPSRNLFGEPIMRAPGADPAATDPPGGAAGEVLSALERSINPFEVRAVVNDEAADELLLLRRGIGMPARYIMAGKERVIDLRDRGRYGDQSPYDRMMEIQTTKRIGGRSLREALTDLVRSEGYQNLTPGTAAQPGGARYMVASRVVQAYQDAALAIVKQENEQLRQDFRYLYSLRNAAKFEGETGVERVQALFGVRP